MWQQHACLNSRLRSFGCGKLFCGFASAVVRHWSSNVTKVAFDPRPMSSRQSSTTLTIGKQESSQGLPNSHSSENFHNISQQDRGQLNHSSVNHRRRRLARSRMSVVGEFTASRAVPTPQADGSQTSLDGLASAAHRSRWIPALARSAGISRPPSLPISSSHICKLVAASFVDEPFRRARSWIPRQDYYLAEYPEVDSLYSLAE